ncbi:MAG: hypothetical protein KI790_03345 [Cyclobacteriaceae bacterium]|nr:hypothetical protein [Cyclobacteriaceae bacterium HetDA_MAG_MS6]
MKITLSFSFLVFIVLSSCAPNAKNSELETLKKEVMEIHDEVMPKMGDLRKTRKALLDKAEDLDEAAAKTLLEQADRIDEAHKGMMQWMRAYEPDFAGTEDEIKKYLEEQKVAIQKVKDDMLNSVKSGANLLENN